MKTNLPRTALTLLALASTLSGAAPAWAQVAGSSTTTGVVLLSSTEAATGWSVKKTLLGKNVYNEAGKKVGAVQGPDHLARQSRLVRDRGGWRLCERGPT